jgi:hypothetical protein|tara:strand:- start:182 stop:565 length:384 start_codon:yes stop_codon:yes gene_type:complete
MDKKQIKDMNAKWKDFRLVEARHGFDLTDFKPGGYKKVLKALGIPMRSKIGNPDKGFQWKGRGILIVTGNDPITGKFRNPDRRDPERNYASYIGIEGDADKVKRAVELIKKHTSYRKGESKGTRGYI